MSDSGIIPQATGGFSKRDIGLLFGMRPLYWSLTPTEAVVRARWGIFPLVEASVTVATRTSAKVNVEPE